MSGLEIKRELENNDIYIYKDKKKISKARYFPKMVAKILHGGMKLLNKLSFLNQIYHSELQNKNQEASGDSLWEVQSFHDKLHHQIQYL
jgi:hypothetical protein